MKPETCGQSPHVPVFGKARLSRGEITSVDFGFDSQHRHYNAADLPRQLAFFALRSASRAIGVAL